MKSPIIRYTLTIIYLVVFQHILLADYQVGVHQELDNGQCYGSIVVAVSVDAGPFDI